MNTVPILNIKQFNQEETQLNFYSNVLSTHLKKNEKIIHKAHKHDFYLCVLFTKGTGIHEIDFNSYTVNPGSVFFLKPGQVHSWLFKSPPEGFIFFHTQEFYDFYFSSKSLSQFPFYYSYKNPPNLQLKTTELAIIESRFKEINKESNSNHIYKKQKIASLLNVTYIDLSRIYSTEIKSRKVISSTYLETLEALEILIEEFYKKEKSALFYANKLNITTKHLNRITKSSINKTTSELISERIILEAKRLLIHSKNTLSLVSETLGYEDYAYFSRIFKLKTKSTPKEFKRQF